MGTTILKDRMPQNTDQPTKDRLSRSKSLELSPRGPTGPRTRRGKQRSRYNAIKHGIFSETVLKGCESTAQFRSLLRALQTDRRPEGALEELLVEKLASLFWRSRRFLRAECAEIAKASEPIEADKVEHYVSKLSVEELERILLMPQEGVVAQRQYTIDASLVLPQEVLDRLLRYEASIDRSLDRTLNQLERLQRMRLGHTVPPPVKVELSR